MSHGEFDAARRSVKRGPEQSGRGLSAAGPPHRNLAAFSTIHGCDSGGFGPSPPITLAAGARQPACRRMASLPLPARTMPACEWAIL